MSKTALVAFAKDPSRVPVKTRLSKDFDQKKRREIYTALLKDCLVQLKSVNGANKYLACYPSKETPFFEELSSQFNYKLLNQRGRDLGERMENCFIELKKHYDRVVIFGTDTPNLPVPEIEKAVKQDTSWDVLIGDSLDGGYYAIGINDTEFKPIFENVAWGKGKVLKTTMANCQKLKLSIKFLKEASDIDTVEDLQGFASNLNAIDKEKIKYISIELNNLNIGK